MMFADREYLKARRAARPSESEWMRVVPFRGPPPPLFVQPQKRSTKMKSHARLLGMLALVAAATAAGCSQEATSAKAAAQVAQAPKPRAQTLIVPTGTNIVASLVTPLSTDTNHSGDQFVATTQEPIVVDGRTVVRSGAQIRGVLQGVQASGRVSGRAQMTLAFQEIVDAQGGSHSISAQPLTLQAASATGGDVEKIAAGGIAGAIIGGITGGAKGAAIGTAVGAGAGTIVVLATKGDDIELGAGQRLNVQMIAPTSITLAAAK